MKKKFLHFSLLALLAASGLGSAHAQLGGNLSGDLMLNGNFFSRNPKIGADNELYNNFLSGGESWLGLRYSYSGFTAFLRMDAFTNSNLKDPTTSMSDFGIGAWSISKDINRLSITGGYIYDQIGSGIIFRAYEDRGLLIDNALAGIHLKYSLSDNISVKAFTGQQKNVLKRFNPIIKGVNVESDFIIDNKVFLNSGVGVVNRTLDKESFNSTFSKISALPKEEQFATPFNTYAFSAYNTLTAGDFSWYIEGAYKTKEAITDISGTKVREADGSVLFSTLNYARKGIAVTLTGKRTEDFALRTSTDQTLLDGMINWQPIIAQIRPQRLIARYTPASQDLSEMGTSANVLITPNDNYDFNLSYTHINTLDNTPLYREAYVEANIRSIKRIDLDLGIQYMHYNQLFYQNKGEIIKAFTPFAELTYRVKNKQSLKVQAQYMETKQDYGSWAFLSLEYAIAPKWSFAISDMYNIKPTETHNKEHYYNFFVAYTQQSHRFSLAWVKQVEGINCTGGVCRYEPAFNGLKLMITSTF